jgi:hypothetical protein
VEGAQREGEQPGRAAHQLSEARHLLLRRRQVPPRACRLLLGGLGRLADRLCYLRGRRGRRVGWFGRGLALQVPG